MQTEKKGGKSKLQTTKLSIEGNEKVRTKTVLVLPEDC